MQDLAVGVDPGGADAWLWQDTMALGMRVGAPPDDFNRKGQDWGLPPFDPWRLRMAGYDPWIRTVRSGLRAAGGIRVDHVMGLFRLFWIPLGATAGRRRLRPLPPREMLDILALESHRAGAYIVGEDLGTVEDFVRARSWPSGASSPTGCCGSSRTARPSSPPRRWPPSPPMICRPSPGCGRAPTWPSSTTSASTPTRRAAQGHPPQAGRLERLARRRRPGRRRRQHPPPPGLGAVDDPDRHP